MDIHNKRVYNTRSVTKRTKMMLNETKPSPPYLVLVLDTETTGLIPKLACDLDKKPYIIQLAYVIYDLSANIIVETYNQYIRLDDATKLTETTTKITGITLDILVSQGIDIVDALVSLYYAYRKCNEIVAHNISFDKEVILIELERHYHAMVERGCSCPESIFNTLYNNTHGVKYFDTMHKGMELCNILLPSKSTGSLRSNEVMISCGDVSQNDSVPQRMYRKYPTLSELSRTLFGEVPDGLHNAIEDVKLCLKCYLAITNR